jgi:soluble lytic murein transglycosylase-like protein
MGEMITNAPEQVEVPQIALKQATGGNCEQYRSLVEQYSDWDSNIMLAIMRGESNCNPNSVNWADGHNGCQGSFSLLQVACLHYSDGQDKFDPSTNIQVAHNIWLRSGYMPWAVYSQGTYLKYI